MCQSLRFMASYELESASFAEDFVDKPNIILAAHHTQNSENYFVVDCKSKEIFILICGLQGKFTVVWKDV